jgi:A/G-specific adenine glycosylase
MFFGAALFQQRLLQWYGINRRDLPWRVPLQAPPDATPDAYHVLVSEAMLQQTQVATVIPFFRRFTEAFPTLAALAEADEQEVLRQWQGLGYYSRARHLRAAAAYVMNHYAGQLPQTVEQLLAMPGVGRYTAGAIASLAFNQRAPILDGNVTRVICRIDAIETDPRDRETQQLLWQRSEQLLPASQPGDFNSALMELGATVCTPRTPRCLLCPVQQHCEALAKGKAEQLPITRRRPPTPTVRRWTFAIQRQDRWLIEQRPAAGRWASLWQFVTVDPGGQALSRATVKAIVPVAIDSPRPLGKVRHALTHRKYEFEVYVCRTRGPGRREGIGARRWVRLDELGAYPLSRPQLKIAQLLRELN